MIGKEQFMYLRLKISTKYTNFFFNELTLNRHRPNSLIKKSYCTYSCRQIAFLILGSRLPVLHHLCHHCFTAVHISLIEKQTCYDTSRWKECQTSTVNLVSENGNLVKLVQQICQPAFKHFTYQLQLQGAFI